MDCPPVWRRPDDFEEVIWMDEKWFVSNNMVCFASSNKQNERFWVLKNPKEAVNFKEQDAQKIMCRAAVVDGQVFVHWLSAVPWLNSEQVSLPRATQGGTLDSGPAHGSKRRPVVPAGWCRSAHHGSRAPVIGGEKSTSASSAASPSGHDHLGTLTSPRWTTGLGNSL